MNSGLWLCAALVAVSASASAKCPDCECLSALEGVGDNVEQRDVAINARVITGTVPDTSRKERFVLRPINGEPVAVKSEKLHVDTYDTLVLSPTAPLAKNTDYELVLLRGAETIPYSRFHTTDTTDTTAPTWKGSIEAEFLPPDDCSVACSFRQGARVEITAPTPRDDRSGVEFVSVWVTDGASIDYAKPPTAHVRSMLPNDDIRDVGVGMPPTSVVIVLGGAGPCQQQSIPLPPHAKRVRVGMKAIDRAGNASAPRDVEVLLAAAKAK